MTRGSRSNQWIPSRSFFVATIGVTTFITASVIFGSVSAAKLDLPAIFGLLLVAISMALNTTTLFYSGFTHAMRRGSVPVLKDPRSMLASVGATQGLTAILGISGRISADELVVVSMIFQAWSVHLFFKIANDSFQVTQNDVRFAPSLLSGAVAVTAIASLSLRNWFAPILSLNALLLWQNIVMSAGLAGVLLWISILPGRRLPGMKISESIALRLSGRTQSVTRKALFTASTISCLLSFSGWVASNVIRAKFNSDLSIWLCAGVSFLFIPALFLSWSELRDQASQHAELVASSRLAGAPAVRFLKRNQRQSGAWAAAVGIRTTVFTIDHDPENQIGQSLPSTLNQIRSEEILRCVNEVLAHRIMHQHVSGQRIFGALDPEHCSRPAIELLKLFACLYLDAGPLLERRINGLTTLLPIVNPGLARVLKPDVLSNLMKRNQWFFHFDYHWVDQHMINTPNATRYGVHIDPISSELRQAMVEHLQKARGMGSFLWLGTDAHERLLLEAPMLGPIVEPITLKLNHEHEQLVFVIKFENLIPRLQRYFDLDHTQSILTDFEPSLESAKLINIFKLQASQAKDVNEVINLVEALASYPWRGFKEKDHALKIIVLAQQFASHTIATIEQAGNAISKDILRLQLTIQNAVEKIGYPAQILHHAQLHKIALRDMQKLVEVARTPVDSRFEESWVLLSASDLKRYNTQERELVISLIQDGPAIHRILDRHEVQGKVIYAVLNVIKAEWNLGRDHLDVHSIFTNLTVSLCQKSPSPETLTILLDSMAFASQLVGKEIQLSGPAKSTLEKSIQLFETSKKEYSKALWSRWAEIRQKRAVMSKVS